jgi:hypothetical protein
MHHRQWIDVGSIVSPEGADALEFGYDDDDDGPIHKNRSALLDTLLPKKAYVCDIPYSVLCTTDSKPCSRGEPTAVVSYAFTLHGDHLVTTISVDPAGPPTAHVMRALAFPPQDYDSLNDPAVIEIAPLYLPAWRTFASLHWSEETFEQVQWDEVASSGGDVLYRALAPQQVEALKIKFLGLELRRAPEPDFGGGGFGGSGAPAPEPKLPSRTEVLQKQRANNAEKNSPAGRAAQAKKKQESDAKHQKAMADAKLSAAEPDAKPVQQSSTEAQAQLKAQAQDRKDARDAKMAAKQAKLGAFRAKLAAKKGAKTKKK